MQQGWVNDYPEFQQKSKCAHISVVHFDQLGCNNPSWIADGYCDDENNNGECYYDGGDCCGPNIDTLYCTECICHE